MNNDKLRTLLNIVFLILAVASVVIYFVAKEEFTLFFYTCMAAIFIKVMEFFIRFTR